MNKKLLSAFLAFALSLSAVLPADIASLGVSAASSLKIYINEVCSSNSGKNGNLIDQTEEGGSYCDWIELYNPNSADIDLSGYGVSDNEEQPFLCTLASNTVIKAGKYLIVYCSKTYAGDKSKPNAAIGISADGETLLITSPDSLSSDIVTVPALDNDKTYGRSPNDVNSFYIMDPTPNASNNITDVTLCAPVFSVQSGIYADDFELDITCETKGVTIYYTTDGSDPTDSNTKIKYTDSITVKDRTGDKNVLSAVSPRLISAYSGGAVAPSDSAVDKGTVIRACAVDSNDSSSDVITNSYFVGENFSSYGDMAIMSVTTDYNNLFGYENGIYVLGKTYDDFLITHPGETRPWVIQANFNQSGSDWERDCHIDFIDSDGALGFSQDCGMRTQGDASKDDLQKSFRFYSRADYGEKYFNYELLPDAVDTNGEVVSKYKTFVARSGGNDTQFMKFTDNYLQSLASGRAFDTQQGRPCIIFIDGEYWGFYILQEDYDNDYFEQSYGVNKDEVVVYKSGAITEGNYEDRALFDELYNFITNNSMSNSANYQKACQMMDMQSFIDYMSVEMYINNNDWPDGNYALWRTRTVDESNPYADGKWRFLLFDTEYSTGIYGSSTTMYNYDKISGVVKMQTSQGYLTYMIYCLLKNADFKKQFAISFTDIANVNFNSTNAVNKLTNEYNNYYPYLVQHFKRFLNSSINNARTRYNQIKSFMTYRPYVVTDMLISALKLDASAVNVTLTANDANAGTVLLNTSTIDFAKYSNGTFSGKYISAYSITVKAQPKKGYVFVGWEGSSQSTEPSITLNLSEAVSLKALFEPVTFKYGDIDNNGTINSKDSLLLKKFLASWDVVIDRNAADVNADGSINSKDSLLLKQYLASWNVTLG